MARCKVFKQLKAVCFAQVKIQHDQVKVLQRKLLVQGAVKQLVGAGRLKDPAIGLSQHLPDHQPGCPGIVNDQNIFHLINPPIFFTDRHQPVYT